MITYGMGEKPTLELARQLSEYFNDMSAEKSSVFHLPSSIMSIPQTVYLARKEDIPGGIREDDIVLHSHEQCLKDKRMQIGRAHV